MGNRVVRRRCRRIWARTAHSAPVATARALRPSRPDEARAELATAVAMLREMGMAFWLPEAETALAEVSQ
jgi:hypothetical protein